jgi:hypothetical protein
LLRAKTQTREGSLPGTGVSASPSIDEEGII